MKPLVCSGCAINDNVQKVFCPWASVSELPPLKELCLFLKRKYPKGVGVYNCSMCC